MTLCDFLRQHAEPIPAWLIAFNKETENKFDRQGFLSSRVVYYPGPNDDGHPVKLFGSTRAAHVFVYVDYANHWTQDWLIKRLKDRPGGFRGYHVLDKVNLTKEDLAPRGYRPNVQPRNPKQPEIIRFGFVAILERDHEYDASHGPDRLAVLFLHSDGFVAFDAFVLPKRWDSPTVRSRPPGSRFWMQLRPIRSWS